MLSTSASLHFRAPDPLKWALRSSFYKWGNWDQNTLLEGTAGPDLGFDSGQPRLSCFPNSSAVKNLPAMQATREMRVPSPGWKDSPGVEATHSSTLAWRILWIEEPGWATVHGVAKSWTWLSTQHSPGWECVAPALHHLLSRTPESGVHRDLATDS